MSSKKGDKAAKAAKRQTKLVDAAQVGDVEAMARVMSMFAKMELDGDDFASVKGKLLVKRLAKLGIGDPQLVVQALLRQRDSVLAEGTANGDLTDCPFCFEAYSDQFDQRVPRILRCGHCACQNCYAKMLAPVQPQGNVKPLPCPVCRVVTEVARGQAANLTKNFLLLR